MGVIGNKNRNNLRRVNPYTRHPPIYFLRVVDQATTRSWDANTVVVFRDPYQIRDIFGSSSVSISPVVSYGEYEEDLVHFNNQILVTKNFTTTFSQAPVVVLTLESSLDNTVIEPFLVNRTSGLIEIGVTAPLSGTIRFRAVHSPTYPVVVQNMPNSPATLFTVSAGSASLSGQDYVSASFTAIDSNAPSSFYFETFDETNTGDVAVNVSASVVGVSSSLAQLSAPINNTVFWIGYQ